MAVERMTERELPRDLAALGRRVAARRESVGLTQPALCEATGIGRTTLSQLENGRRDVAVSVLLRLSYFFEVPLSEWWSD